MNKTKLKAKAWKMFSIYIRRKYSDELGMVSCYTCNNRSHWKESQAGHGIPGRNNAVLFLEAIVKPQCVGCNVFGRGRLAIFTRKLIDELGLKEYDRIVSDSNKVVKYSPSDYEDVYLEYFDKVTAL